MQYARITATAAALGILVTPAISQETQLSVDDAIAIVLDAQPGTVEEPEREQFSGRVVAEIEVLNDAGEEIKFTIDLASGEILGVVIDDDPTDDPIDMVLEDVTFLVRVNAGGGWDTMSRGIGQAFTTIGITDVLSFKNKGGVGPSYMTENATTLPKTIMPNTTQIVVRSLNGTYSYSYAELVPVAAPMGDFAAFTVQPESNIKSMTDLQSVLQKLGSRWPRATALNQPIEQPSL